MITSLLQNESEQIKILKKKDFKNFHNDAKVENLSKQLVEKMPTVKKKTK